MFIDKRVLFTGLIAAQASCLLASYTPKEGQLGISTGFTATTFDEFYSGQGGDTEGPTPGDESINRYVVRTYLFYGLTDDVVLDFSFAYAAVSAFEGIPGSVGDQEEFADFHLGIGWQPLREQEDGFDLFLRAGAVIEGTYDTGALSAPGDGTSGVELGFKVGKTLTDFGLRADATANYSFVGEGVPDVVYLKAGPSLPLPGNFRIDTSLIYLTAVEDGLDIGGPGFGTRRTDNPSALRDLPLVEEEAIAGELGLAYSRGRYYWRASVSQVFDGRNVGKELTFGISVSFAIDNFFQF